MTRKLSGKFIQDSAVTLAKIAVAARTGILAGKQIAGRKGVLNLSALLTTSSTIVTTEVTAVATTLVPQPDLDSGLGVFTGAISNGVADSKVVLIRIAGTNEGVDDGSSNEVYGLLTEATGVYTLSYYTSAGAAYTFPTTTAIDFYFVEVQDLSNLSTEALLFGSVTGVVDAQSAATLAGHLNGGSSKHDADEIDVEASGTYYSAGDLEQALADLDSGISSAASSASAVAEDVGHLVTLSGVAGDSDHLGTFTGLTIADSVTVKVALQSLETSLETKAASSVVTEIDANVDDLVTLSGVAENTSSLGTFTGTTIPDSSTVKAALQSLETSVETKAASSVVAEIDTNVDDLITLSGVAENATDLGTFTGTIIPDSSTVKAALQALETASGASVKETTQSAAFTLSGTNITNKYVDLASVPKTPAFVRMFVVDGLEQDYGVDFTIITDGSSVKRLTWDSGAGGGPSSGMVADLLAGDKLRVYWQLDV